MSSARSGPEGRLVVDASAAAEYLLRTPLGRGAAALLEGSTLFAPELLDVEVTAVLRKAALTKRISESRAAVAIEDLRDWPLTRVSHALLLCEAWSLRKNVTAYDAFYVAAARRCKAGLVTADGPLSRAPAMGVLVHNLRAG